MKKFTTVAVVVLGFSTALFACGMNGGQGGCGSAQQQKGTNCQKHNGMQQQKGMGCQKSNGMQQQKGTNCQKATGMNKGEQSKKHKMFAIISKLNLTDEQMAKFRDIRKSKMESQRAFKLEKKAIKAHNKKGMDLSKFMTVEKFDKDGVRAMLTQKLEAKKAKMIKLKTAKINTKVDTMEKIFNLLTPEQRVALIEQFKK